MSDILQCLRSVTYGALTALRNVTFALICAILPANAAPLTLVALGDSLTAGYGLPDGDGLVPQLQTWLDAQGVAVTVINAGVSGDTTAGALARLGWSVTPDVDAMMVILGGNDLLRGISPVDSRANLDAILAQTAGTGMPVLLVPMAAPGNYGPDYKAQFDAIYPDLAAKYSATLTDSYFTPLTGGNPDPSAIAQFMQADGLHPNKDGVAKIVESLGPKVQALLASVGK